MATGIVSPAITDSVTQSNTTVLGINPSAVTGNLMQMASQITGLSMQNAASGQQQVGMIQNASIAQGLNVLYSVDTSATAQAVDTINRSTDYSKMVDAETVEATLPQNQPLYGG